MNINTFHHYRLCKPWSIVAHRPRQGIEGRKKRPTLALGCVQGECAELTVRVKPQKSGRWTSGQKIGNCRDKRFTSWSQNCDTRPPDWFTSHVFYWMWKEGVWCSSWINSKCIFTGWRLQWSDFQVRDVDRCRWKEWEVIFLWIFTASFSNCCYESCFSFSHNSTDNCTTGGARGPLSMIIMNTITGRCTVVAMSPQGCKGHGHLNSFAWETINVDWLSLSLCLLAQQRSMNRKPNIVSSEI